MGTSALLQRLHSCGISVRADGDRLLVTPSGKVTPELRERIKHDKAALMSVLSAPRPEPRSANPLMTYDQGEDCHRGGWNDAEISMFSARTARMQRLAIDETMSEDIAERLTLRDREFDDRRMCVECSSLSDSGRCMAAAAGRIYGADPRLEPVKLILQRCEGFGLRKGLT